MTIQEAQTIVAKKNGMKTFDALLKWTSHLNKHMEYVNEAMQIYGNACRDQGAADQREKDERNRTNDPLRRIK